jgi:hypothetical protein
MELIIALAVIVFFFVLLGYVISAANNSRRLARMTFDAMPDWEQDRVLAAQRRRHGLMLVLGLIIFLMWMFGSSSPAPAMDMDVLKGSFVVDWFDINCRPVKPLIKTFAEFDLGRATVEERRQASIDVILNVSKLSAAEFCEKYRPRIESLERNVGG